MCRALFRRAPAPLAAFALLATVALPAPPALASRPREAAVYASLQQVHHIRVSGALIGVTENPDGTGMLAIHSKTHATTYHVAMTAATVVKLHKQPVHRDLLMQHKNQSVTATCLRRPDGTLVALTVTIVNRRHKKK